MIGKLELIIGKLEPENRYRKILFCEQDHYGLEQANREGDMGCHR
jgi:hypothetical protein